MNNKYFETIALCTGTQNKMNVPGWTTLHEFDNTSKNKDFDAIVYKKGDRIVITFAGTNTEKINSDFKNDIAIYNPLNHIPSQYGDAEQLYNHVKAKYGNLQIEFMGYSLGATIANLLSHRTGLPSHAIAPIGSKHIADKYKDYFKYDDSKIVSYGRHGDIAFESALRLKRQSGTIVILPGLKKDERGGDIATLENHYLHNFGREDLSKTQIYKNGESYISKEKLKNLDLTELRRKYLSIPMKKVNYTDMSGWKNPVDGDKKIYTLEYIKSLSAEELEEDKDKISIQAKTIGIPTEKEMQSSQSEHGNLVHVSSYVRESGVHVRDYWRSK